ncbi:eCIS core domain-containing protein [Christiangramia crocea]|uniref:DUF4157 domain-containing protein n=1 Tax=Christiangramia crocea TaxID=2904124 RepID=A0A9X1UYG1_9FLAO|nr:DUF4157 domain-containing protein [Gramella crocea]MCG9972579.1 DUF4157 domain-containing protein [Gramella crocea]
MFSKSAVANISSSSDYHPAFKKKGDNLTRSDVFIQPKMQVDSSTSKYEAEADNMADYVMQATDTYSSLSFISPTPVQRMTQTVGNNSTGPDAERVLDDILPPELASQPTSNEEKVPEKNPPEENLESPSPEPPNTAIKIPPKPESGKADKEKKEVREDQIEKETEKTRDKDSEDSKSFQGEPSMEPLVNIPITKDISNQFLQTKSLSDPETEQQKDPDGEETLNTGFDKKTISTDDENKNDLISRKGKGNIEVDGTVESEISSSKNAGDKLPGGIRSFMEKQFTSDFSNVRVHYDDQSVKLNNQLHARAFTHKNHIYFNRGQYNPSKKEGQHLLAHELTHVVQQGASIRRKPQISSSHPGTIQRLGIGDALDYFADKAHYIPGFRMFTIILGVNPINMERVDRSPANIIKAMVEFLPGGKLITDALDSAGIFDDASSWFKNKMDSLSITGSSIKSAIHKFLDSLGWSDIFDLGDVWRRAKRIFTSPINRLIEFGKGLVSEIMKMVKSAILRPLALLAEGTPAYDLLRVVLGEDPITGDPYPPTAENLIGGFMKLIGQEEVWENIKQGNAIEKAYNWFQGALQGLMGFVRAIPTTILETIRSLSWRDLVLISNAFRKVGNAFLNVAGKFLDWAGGTVLNLLEILFSVVAPAAVPWIKKAGAAFSNILKNPVGFIGNLVKAAKNGFQKFASNIGKHLKKALLNWLMGSLAGTGIHIPESLSFQEIIKFVLSVLGVTWERVREKLVKHLGEPAVKALETGFELVTILVTRGPMAMWERIQEKLSDLKSMVIEEISSWVVTKVVTKAVTKLVSSLNPAGAVIQAIIFIYDTITFLIDKISQIARVGMAVLNSMSSIANGVINTAIKKVEDTLAGMLSLAISFFAKFLGLGKISEKILSIVKKVQDKVDKAIDHVIGWIVKKGKAFLKKVVSTGVPEDPKARLDMGMKKAVKAVNKLSGKVTIKMIKPILKGIKLRYGFQYLRTVNESGVWYLEGKVNPDKKEQVDEGKIVEEPDKPIEENKDSPISKYLDNQIFENDNSKFSSIGNEIKNEIEELGYRFVKAEGKYHIRRQSAQDLPAVHIDEEGYLRDGTKSGASDHTEYKPVITDWNIQEGGIKINYTYEDGEQKDEKFTTMIDFGAEAEARSKKITSSGQNISIKKAGTRGATDSSGKILGDSFKKLVAGKSVHSAHLIADWFRGSGYAGSGNLIPASSNYNLEDMADKEKEIFDSETAKTPFNLKVSANMEVFSDKSIEDAIEKEKLHGNEENKFSEKEVAKVMNKLSKELDPMYATKTVYEMNGQGIGELSEDQKLKEWIKKD